METLEKLIYDLYKKKRTSVHRRRNLQCIINLYKEPALRKRLSGRKEEDLLYFR